MLDKRIENLNVISEAEIITPEQLREQLPQSDKAVQTVMCGQQSIKEILDGKDNRLFAIVGPCSIHDVKSAKEYAVKLKALAEQVKDTMFLVMRVYFEKPRTRAGWQGLISDPFLDNTCHMEEGLKMARQLLRDVAEIGIPSAVEALDIVSPQYIQDLVSWTAIGARTTESQSHRKMASGLSCPVGFKNGTNGSLDVSVNAIHFSSDPHNFISTNPKGKVAVVRTKGNPYTHIVLRGGHGEPNYSAHHINKVEAALENGELPVNIMVDCSHANSGKKPERQKDVLGDIVSQIERGNKSIVGFMLESNLNSGRQNIPENLEDLEYGVSVTDACIDWDTTVRVILDTHGKLLKIRDKETR